MINFFADVSSHLIPGSLTPPDKINGDGITTSPLSISTLAASSIQTPPSPVPTPSPPMSRHPAEIDHQEKYRNR